MLSHSSHRLPYHHLSGQLLALTITPPFPRLHENLTLGHKLLKYHQIFSIILKNEFYARKKNSCFLIMLTVHIFPNLLKIISNLKNLQTTTYIIA